MKRKQHSAQFKAGVALEATKGQKTVNRLASEYRVHPTQISHWKRQLQEGVQEIFSSKRQKQEKEDEELKATLYQEIGQLKFELDWLNSILGTPFYSCSRTWSVSIWWLWRSRMGTNSVRKGTRRLPQIWLATAQVTDSASCTAVPYLGVRRRRSLLVGPVGCVSRLMAYLRA
jgi:transposase-like protein